MTSLKPKTEPKKIYFVKQNQTEAIPQTELNRLFWSGFLVDSVLSVWKNSRRSRGLESHKVKKRREKGKENNEPQPTQKRYGFSHFDLPQLKVITPIHILFENLQRKKTKITFLLRDYENLLHHPSAFQLDTV